MWVMNEAASSRCDSDGDKDDDCSYVVIVKVRLRASCQSKG